MRESRKSVLASIRLVREPERDSRERFDADKAAIKALLASQNGVKNGESGERVGTPLRWRGPAASHVAALRWRRSGAHVAGARGPQLRSSAPDSVLAERKIMHPLDWLARMVARWPYMAEIGRSVRLKRGGYQVWFGRPRLRHAPHSRLEGLW